MTEPKPGRTMEGGAAPAFDPADIEKNKTMAGLAYILFFLPLVACPDSRFGRFHANQGLILLILAFGGGIVLFAISAILTLISPFLALSLSGLFYIVYYILVLVLMVMGLIGGLNGQAKELPFIGGFRLLK